MKQTTEANHLAKEKCVALKKDQQQQEQLAFKDSVQTTSSPSMDTAATSSHRIGHQERPTLSTAPPLCCYNLLFPRKVLRILSDAEKYAGEGWDKIISWVPDGKGFKIHDTKKFSLEIMPRYFGSSKFRTFQRSLNLWEFKTPLSGPDRGVSSHPMFQRDAPDLCENMKRIVKKRSQQQEQRGRAIDTMRSTGKKQHKPQPRSSSEELLVSPPSQSSRPPSPNLHPHDTSSNHTVSSHTNFSAGYWQEPSAALQILLVEREARALIIEQQVSQNQILMPVPEDQRLRTSISTNSIGGSSTLMSSLPRAGFSGEPIGRRDSSEQRLYSMFAASSSASNIRTSHTSSMAGSVSSSSALQEPVLSSNKLRHAAHSYPQLLNEYAGIVGRRASIRQLPVDHDRKARQALQGVLVDQAARLVARVRTIDGLLARKPFAVPPQHHQHF